ncbi:unnamed protein product [Adineta ricciae]|nr:unnamed protein product [Adineta ricciae]
MSKVVRNDSSDDDDILYSINSDISDVHDDGDEEDDETDESSEGEGIEVNASQDESWSGKRFKSNLPIYNGELQLSSSFRSELPRSPSPIDYFRLFLTPELVSYIVDQSNLYRIQTNRTKQSPMNETD